MIHLPNALNLDSLARCPDCQATLERREKGFACSNCRLPFNDVQSVPCFLDGAALAQITSDRTSDRENDFKNWFKRWPRFYDFMVRTITPVLFNGLTARRFLARYKTGVGLRLLNVGSGPLRLHPDVVNVDLFPFPNVDILAQATRLPFADGTFDVVCCDQVLEHVRQPQHMIHELIRVTKPGGHVYIGVPFMYPLHPSPRDFTRWTHEGLLDALAPCTEIERGVMAGPTSGMLAILAMWLATVFSFGIRPLRKGLHYVFMITLCPIKLLDILYARLPGAEDVACAVYVVARTPSIRQE
jgi:SAM-dependent methyltransferase